MDEFYILTNWEKDTDGSVTNRITDYIKRKGKKIKTVKDGSQIDANADCIIVLGGDGTVLRTARKTMHLDIPIIGINLGNLGYLAEISIDNIESSIDRLIDDDYTIESRMMISAEGQREGKTLFTLTALNDFVITRQGPLTGIEFYNYLNGQFMNKYICDAIIVSTATGSTGYNLAAGGPIVSPSTGIMILTPLAVHSLNSRSIILSKHDELEVCFVQGKRSGENSVIINCDGDKKKILEIGDKLIIRKSDKVTKMIKLNESSFLETLRHKLNG